MRTSKRLGALCGAASAALVLAAAGCSDKDRTEICVGPDCVTYDGVGGRGNVLHDGAAGTGGATAGAAGEPGAAGAAGEPGSAGAAGEPGSAGAAGSPSDAGADAQPDGAIGLPDGGDTDDPDATADPLTDGGTDAGPPSPVCTLAFTSPLAADGGDLALSGTDDIDGEACGSEFTITVSVSSNAQSVTLFVNDNPLVPQDVVNGTVDFAAVLGNRGSTLNELRAEALMADGTTTCDAVLPSSLQVNCPGPSCSIESPVANDDGYLNAGDDGAGDPGLQTNIVVSTEAEHVGETVRLEIDGDLDAVSDELVSDNGATGRATFAVSLDEGTRTVRAECSDAFGVTTLSPETVWKVDVTPCSLLLSSISGSDPLTPSDDEDNDADGIQVFAAGQITGSDCKTLHAGVCGGLVPIQRSLPSNGTFTDFLVTVGSSTGPGQICGAVEDAAGNFSAPTAPIPVNLRFESPEVSLITPTGSSTVYNVLSDGNPGTAACETDVEVTCSEENQPVQLLADGSVIATATCTGGQATFSQASIPSKNDFSFTALTAQQTAAGLPPGVSDPVNVKADCDAPTCSITSPSASPSVLNEALDSDATAGLQIDFTVASNGSNVGLSIDSVAVLTPPVLAAGVATFADVSLGEGSPSAQALCVDAAGNSSSSSPVDFTVDTLPCGLTNLVIAGGVVPVVPNPTLDVMASGDATGGDCTDVRIVGGTCASLSGGTTPLAQPTQTFSNLPLTLPSVGGLADVCVEVTDSSGNIAQFASTVLVRIDVPTVAITSPFDQDEFDTLTTCDTSIVASCSDAGGDVELSIDNGVIETKACTAGHNVAFTVTLPSHNDGTPTSISVLHTAVGLTSLPSSIDVFSDCQGPDTEVAAPSFVNLVPHRENTVRLTWIAVPDTGGDPLTNVYHVRCSAAPILSDANWTSAAPDLTAITTDPLGEGLNDSATSKRFGGFRSGTTRYCAVRGEDAAGLLTPIPTVPSSPPGLLGTSTAVTNPFTPTSYAVPSPFNATTTSLFSVAPVGDVNGDTHNDFIVGYAQRPAQVFFGGSTLNTSAGITINPPATPFGRFGAVVAGLGDINDDDRPDFAVAAPFANTTVSAAGSVYVFFGKAAGNDWPTTALTVTQAPAACVADICFHSSVASGTFGSAVTSTDFNGDGELDLVIGAQSQGPGKVYVLLGGDQLDALPDNTSITMSTTATSPTTLDGFVLNPPTTTAGQIFGGTVAGVGVGSDTKGDLVIGALGGGAVGGAAYLMPGEAYTDPATTGLVTRTLGAAFATGTAADFAFPIAAIGDQDGATPDEVYVGGEYTNAGPANIFLRQPTGFDTGHTLVYANDLPDNDWGRYAADGFHNAFGMIGDLDQDNRSELALGSISLGVRLGTVELFYGASGVVARPRSQADAHFQTADSGHLGVNFVGDIDGDGFNDLVLFDTDAVVGTGTGSSLTLLH